jgi:hypothetical protein
MASLLRLASRDTDLRHLKLQRAWTSTSKEKNMIWNTAL